MNLKRVIWGPILSLVFLAIFTCVILNINGFFTLYDSNLSVVTASAISSVGPVIEKPKVDLTEINAMSAISVQTNLPDKNIVLFEKDSNAVLPIASLTKLMTAIVILDNYNPSDAITISYTADLQSPMKQDVFLGQKLLSQDLLKMMIIGSSNKSAYALAEKYGIKDFVEAMNAKAKAIGLKNTNFVDVTGISPENISTAQDLSKLSIYILKNYPQIAKISSIREIFISQIGTIYNTDALLHEIPNAVCSKTGFTTEAKGCLLLVVNGKNNNEYIINVVLGADDRFAEMKKLINAYNACN